MAEHDLRQMPRNDLGVLVAGVLAFIASFFPYYGYDVKGAAGAFTGGSASTSAWHSYATLALLLILAATIVAAVQVFAGDTLPSTPVSWNFVVVALSGLGTLLLIIRSFTLDSGDIGPLSYGLRWGAYVLMIVCIVQTVFAVMRLRESGEAMPWHQSAAPPAAPPAAS